MKKIEITYTQDVLTDSLSLPKEEVKTEPKIKVQDAPKLVHNNEEARASGSSVKE
jgi:hypothetical protein